MITFLLAGVLQQAVLAQPTVSPVPGMVIKGARALGANAHYQL